MAVICKCTNGHTFTARVVEDSPDINVIVVEPDYCPECNSDDFEILDIEGDENDIGEL